MTNFDTAVNVFMSQSISPFMVKVADFISLVGDTKVMLALGLIIGFYFLLVRKWQKSVIIIFSVCSTTVAVTVLKELFTHPRPENALQVLSGWSFPSGHAFMAAAFFTAFIYVCYPYFSSKITRGFFIAFCIASVFLIGLSRLILNVHWASDIIAGWALGVSMAVLSIFFVRYLTIAYPSISKPVSKPRDTVDR